MTDHERRNAEQIALAKAYLSEHGAVHCPDCGRLS